MKLKRYSENLQFISYRNYRHNIFGYSFMFFVYFFLRYCTLNRSNWSVKFLMVLCRLVPPVERINTIVLGNKAAIRKLRRLRIRYLMIVDRLWVGHLRPFLI